MAFRCKLVSLVPECPDGPPAPRTSDLSAPQTPGAGSLRSSSVQMPVLVPLPGGLADSKSETSHGIRDGQELSQRMGHKGPAGEGVLLLEEFLSASAVQAPGAAGWRGPPRQLVFT